MQYKVLIVDDSKLARMVMASAFRRVRPDWTLVESANADEALAVVSEGAVDIALVDRKCLAPHNADVAAVHYPG
jgi:CheY-like chemotaxis protein